MILPIWGLMNSLLQLEILCDVTFLSFDLQYRDCYKFTNIFHSQKSTSEVCYHQSKLSMPEERFEIILLVLKRREQCQAITKTLSGMKIARQRRPTDDPFKTFV